MQINQRFYALSKEVYLQWFNDYLTIEKFAEDYGIENLELARLLIEQGRINHERDVKQL